MTAAMAAPDGSGRYVGVSEAARRIGVHKSTISRQVRDGKIPNHGTDALPLVDVEEARRARATNLDLSKQRGPHSTLQGAALHERDDASASRGGGEASAPPADVLGQARQGEASGGMQPPRSPGEPPTSGDDDDGAGPGRAPAGSGAFTREAARLKSVQADNAEMDFLERTRRLVGQNGVDGATSDVFRNLRDRILAVGTNLADRLASMTDAREIRVLLRQEHHRALTQAADDADDPGGDPLDETASDR